MPPIGTWVDTGVTATDSSVAAVTVKVAEPDLPPKLAVMSDAPLARPLAMPVGETETLTGVPEIQLEDVVTSRDDPSPNVAIAINCCMPVIGIETDAGVTATETKVPGSPPLLAQPATKATRSNACLL